MTKLTQHFTLEEFHSPRDPNPIPGWAIARLRSVARALEVIRLRFPGRALRITSGFRPEWLQRQVNPKVTNSQHSAATAADFVVDGISPTELWRTIRLLIVLGKLPRIKGLGWYGPQVGPPKRHVHGDERGTKGLVTWSNVAGAPPGPKVMPTFQVRGEAAIYIQVGRTLHKVEDARQLGTLRRLRWAGPKGSQRVLANRRALAAERAKLAA